MNAFVISLIRTAVPVVVGAFVTWLVSLGIQLPQEAQDGLITVLFAVFTAVYYLLVRILESKWPAVGILLGVAATPDSYSKGAAQITTSAVQTPAPNVIANDTPATGGTLYDGQGAPISSTGQTGGQPPAAG